VVQIVATWVGTACVIWVYFRFYDRSGLEEQGRNPTRELGLDRLRLLLCIAAQVVVFAIPATLAILAGSVQASSVQTFGRIDNVILNIITSFHWLFQLYETYLQWGFGSLSVFSIVIMAAGNLLSAVSFYFDGAPGVAFSYFTAGIMSFIIVGLGAYAERGRCCSRRSRRNSTSWVHTPSVAFVAPTVEEG